jgi:hypothetical protein
MKFAADECCDGMLVAGLREILDRHAARLAGSFVVVDPSKTRFRVLRD